jgi:hypothetical protein
MTSGQCALIEGILGSCEFVERLVLFSDAGVTIGPLAHLPTPENERIRRVPREPPITSQADISVLMCRWTLDMLHRVDGQTSVLPVEFQTKPAEDRVNGW